ncbi:MAG TPA: hypothetical protein VF796_01425 [Humisphaera sp.]
MKLYLGYRSVPELDAFPPDERKRVWDECLWKAFRRHPSTWPCHLAAPAVIASIPLWAGAYSGTVSILPGVLVGGLAVFIVTVAAHQWPARLAIHYVRRRLPGRCSGCGYDLTGNESGVCPECGRPAGGKVDPVNTQAANLADSRAPDDRPTA